MLFDKPMRDFFRSARTQKPSLQLFCVSPSAVFSQAISAAEVQELRVKGPIEAPLSSSGMALVYDDPFLIPSAVTEQTVSEAAAPAAGAAPAAAAVSIVQMGDSEFFAVEAGKLLILSESVCDVYIRLGVDKYVKLIHRGQKPDPTQITKYIQRGVRFFFITTAEQGLYVRYCDALTDAITKNAKVDTGKKLAVTMNLGSQALGLLAFKGVSTENLSYASGFVDKLGRVVHELRDAQSSAITQFLTQQVTHQHSASLAAAGGLIAKALRLESEKSIHIIGLGCTLHDIGLSILGFEGAGGGVDPATLDPEQLALYQTHPTVSADELRKQKSFDATLIQAVEQHHLRKNGKGFPRGGSGSTFIHICAEIVGICDEFDYAIRKKAAVDPKLDLQGYMEALYEDFSRPVVQAFKTTFFRKT
jgi:response regulator RpfG family c-di-GMP phosphodiesterase